MDANGFIQAAKASQRLAETTIRDYGQAVKRFDKFIGGREPDVDNISQYLIKMREEGKSSTHIIQTMYAIKRYMRWKGLEDPFATGRIDMPSVEISSPDPHDVPTEEDIGNIFQACRTPLEKALTLFLYQTGSRISEVLRLEVKDIDWETGETQVIRKGRRGKKEAIALYKETLEYLKQYIQWNKELVNKTGKLFPYDYASVYSYMGEVLKRANITFPKGHFFHLFRHAFVIHQLEQDTDIRVVSQAVGHSSLNTTIKIYGVSKATSMLDRMAKPKVLSSINEETPAKSTKSKKRRRK